MKRVWFIRLFGALKVMEHQGPESCINCKCVQHCEDTTGHVNMVRVMDGWTMRRYTDYRGKGPERYQAVLLDTIAARRGTQARS